MRVPKKTARSETGVPDMVDFYCAKEVRISFTGEAVTVPRLTMSRPFQILAFHSLHFKT